MEGGSGVGSGRGRVGGSRGRKGGGGGLREEEGKAREGLNASHVKLMRTNLQKMESCFPFTNSLLLFFCLVSRSLRC